MSVRLLTRNSVLFRGLVLGALAVSVAGISAVAQPAGGPGGGPGGGGFGGGPGGPGGGFPPELRAKIEAAEAKTVAESLSLDAEKSGKLAEALTAARKAAAENRPEGGARGDFEAMRKMQEEQQAKLETSFKAFLDEAQAKEAASVLGGFNRWDRLVAVVLGFGLDEAKQSQALGLTLTYVKAAAKARAENAGAGNPDAARAAMVAAKKTLDDAIAPLLSDAQKAEWAEKTARGQRGGGGAERRDRGDGGAGAPPAGPPASGSAKAAK